MKTISKILAVVAGFIILSAFITEYSNTTGSLSVSGDKEERNVKDFSEIAMSVSGTVYVTQGSPCKVVLEGDQNDLDKIETVVDDGKLKIKAKPRLSNFGKITAYVTCPNIEGLYVAGSGDMIAENDFNTEELELKVSGSGKMKLKGLQSEEIDMAVSGSGDIYIEGAGQAEEADIAISGSGKVYAENLKVNECDARISGSGSCKIHAVNELDARISGSGSVYYKGNPKIDASTSGSGKVKSL